GALAEADAFECRARGGAQFLFAARISPEAERMPGVRLDRERDIVERGEIGKQRRDLKRARQPKRAAAIDRKRRDISAVEMDAARVGRKLAGKLADQRGLARAVRPDDGVQLA